MTAESFDSQIFYRYNTSIASFVICFTVGLLVEYKWSNENLTEVILHLVSCRFHNISCDIYFNFMTNTKKHVCLILLLL